MAKIFKFLLSKEFFFVLFLTSGYFKSAESTVDLTVLFLGVTILLTLRDTSAQIEKSILRPVITFVLIYSIILIGFLYSPSTTYALDKLLKFTLLTAPSFVIGITIIKSKESVQRLLKSFVSVGVAMATYAVYLFLSNNTEIGFVGLGDGNYLGLGRVTGITFLILLTWVTFSKESRIKTLALITLFLIVVTALTVSGARMPLLAAAAVGALVVLNSVRIKNGVLLVSKGFKYLLYTLIIGIAFISWLFSKGYLATIAYRVTVLFTESQGGASAAGRLDRFDDALHMFSISPLFGKGLGSFPLIYTGVDVTDYPHNIFLEFMSELGLIGLLLLLFLITQCIFPVFKNGFNGMETERIALLACFIFLFLNANTTGDINDNRMMFTFLAMFYKSEIIKRSLFKNNEKKAVISTHGRLVDSRYDKCVRGVLSK